MNNEPVAWTEEEIKKACRHVGLTEHMILRIKAYLPVHTHPVKEQLTDEEIEELWYDPRFIGDPVAFGKAVLRATKNIPLQTDEEICKKCDALTERAILRKAQEK